MFFRWYGFAFLAFYYLYLHMLDFDSYVLGSFQSQNIIKFFKIIIYYNSFLTILIFQELYSAKLDPHFLIVQEQCNSDFHSTSRETLVSSSSGYVSVSQCFRFWSKKLNLKLWTYESIARKLLLILIYVVRALL